ncbi:phage tail tape measure protein [Blautia producta]|uniref:phage tail tape measure protein n=1 Tax=Blautia producta TaxID=33035 RepID=UPI001F2EF569|nr:phage tail tape measure protein [Blautia producta]
MIFEDSMANVNTLLDDPSHLEGYKNAVRRISDNTGLSLETMSAGMYQAISSLGDGGEETERIFLLQWPVQQKLEAQRYQIP